MNIFSSQGSVSSPLITVPIVSKLALKLSYHAFLAPYCRPWQVIYIQDQILWLKRCSYDVRAGCAGK